MIILHKYLLVVNSDKTVAFSGLMDNDKLDTKQQSLIFDTEEQMNKYISDNSLIVRNPV